MNKTEIYIPKILRIISKTLHEKGAKAIVVGGSVRDFFLNLSSKDYDIEVYGLKSIKELEEILSSYGSVNLVGKSFGVLKLSYKGKEYDFSLPRCEKKIDKGHKGFDIEIDGSLKFKTAAKRRDFSINAIGYDIEKKYFIDPFGGIEDISRRVLCHIEDKTFTDDPLRIYRAVQLCARFGFTMTNHTKKLCKKMVADGILEELPKERIYTEWKKFMLKASRPSYGFELMRELGILERYFPELYAIIGVPQSPKWHPEGDVWIHTMMAVDTMADLIKSEKAGSNKKKKLKFLFAILCHDLGKATHTTIVYENGQTVPYTSTSVPLSNILTINAIGHEKAGMEPTKSLMYRLTDEHDFINNLLPLVEHHLKPSLLYNTKAKSSSIRKLSTKVNIEELVTVAKADFLGRTTKDALAGVYYAGEWLTDRAKELKVSNKPPEPLLKGRDLIMLGMTPSPKFKEILDKIYTLQIEGKLATKNNALNYIIDNFSLQSQ